MGSPWTPALAEASGDSTPHSDDHCPPGPEAFLAPTQLEIDQRHVRTAKTMQMDR